MTIDIEIHKQVNPLWWDERLAASRAGSIFQTTYWAEFLRAQEGVQPLYLVARERGDVVGLWMLTRGCQWRDPIPLEQRDGLAQLRVTAELRWHHGPVVLRAERLESVLSALCGGLDELARDERIGRIVGQCPPVDGDVHHRVLTAAGFVQRPCAVLRIDTTTFVDVLWKNLKPSVRKAVRHAEEQGVRVERIEPEMPLEACHAVLRDAPPHFPNAVMWNFLRPSKHLEVFLAWQGKRALAGLGVLVFNGVVTEMSAASLQEAPHADDFIRWHVIRWAHERGHRAYDLVSPVWGGRWARCDEFSKTYPIRQRQWWCEPRSHRPFPNGMRGKVSV
jgi:hypothetical protein